jgi:hypothetical protein
LIAAGSVCLFVGCSSTPKRMSPTAFTEHALAATSAASTNFMAGGSDASKRAIAQFEKFNGDFTLENITNNTANVYAADVYFRDPFKEIHGEPAFEAYLARSAKAVASYSMDWKDVAEHDGNFYFRWVMTLKLKRDSKNKPPTMTTGMSHVRFGADGKVIFHQDYYDAGEFLYEKIPIMGGIIRHIKKSL